MENPLQNIVFKSITLKTVHGRKIFHTWKESEKLIYEKKYVYYCCNKMHMVIDNCYFISSNDLAT